MLCPILLRVFIDRLMLWLQFRCLLASACQPQGTNQPKSFLERLEDLKCIQFWFCPYSVFECAIPASDMLTMFRRHYIITQLYFIDIGSLVGSKFLLLFRPSIGLYSIMRGRHYIICLRSCCIHYLPVLQSLIKPYKLRLMSWALLHYFMRSTIGLICREDVPSDYCAFQIPWGAVSIVLNADHYPLWK